ncbi:hypothetical protein VNI00_019379 [Paramarasmius palmivorus]|uniref:Uncharacterized protein n=1 Tax=Paramarasmius palmivorus TaxID=297713 RepID=A0AAW0AN41_9AGAR
MSLFDDNPDSTSGVVPPISTSTGPNSGSPTSKSQNAGSTQSNPTAVVLGTVLGGVAALAAAGLIIYFYRRRRKLERHFEVGGGGVESNSTQHHPPQPNTASLPTPGPIPPQTPPWNTNANQNPAVRASRALSDEVDMVSYIGQDNYTTLPTGEVVLSAATRPSHRYTRTPSSIYTGRPRTLVLHNHDRDSVLPMSPTTVNMQRTRELETQVQGIKREMRYLEVQAAEERGYNGGYGYEGENKSLGEQIQEMREQVRMLQAQIQPPPPGYTVTPTAF